MDARGERISVYLVGPVTGCVPEEAMRWRQEFVTKPPHGLIGIDPMRRRLDLAKGPIMEGEYEGHRLATGRGILAQNWFDVERAQVIFANFLHAQRLSIGSVIEDAWGYFHGIPNVNVMQPGNPHDHPLVRGCASCVTTTVADGVVALQRIIEEQKLHSQRKIDPDVEEILWAVRDSKILLVDLTAPDSLTVPMIIRIAFAETMHKKVVLVVPKGLSKYDPRMHPLIRECAHYFPSSRGAGEGIVEDLLAFS